MGLSHWMRWYKPRTPWTGSERRVEEILLRDEIADVKRQEYFKESEERLRQQERELFLIQFELKVMGRE